MDKLDHLTSIVGYEIEPVTLSMSRTKNGVNKVLSEMEAVEANKNKLDLKPNIDFVANNKAKFEDGLRAILAREANADLMNWSEQINFKGTDNIFEPQILPEECKEILARMPEALVRLSKLQKVDYSYNDKLPVPGFDEQGNFDPGKVEWASAKDFPREGDHPSRILVGYSTGTDIYQTAIPKSVSEDAEATYLYQVHVFLHEFFHTIDYPRRDPEKRSKALLEVDGQKFTLQDWWLAFEELVLSGKEPKCVSSYANIYFDVLNQETKEADYGKFTHALAEQICETFVAYQLGIISNNEGWTDFKKESFGNTEQLTRLIKSSSESANLKWVLMDKLCRAKLISQ